MKRRVPNKSRRKPDWQKPIRRTSSLLPWFRQKPLRIKMIKSFPKVYEVRPTGLYKSIKFQYIGEHSINSWINLADFGRATSFKVGLAYFLFRIMIVQ
jgi:hypothetical protein